MASGELSGDQNNEASPDPVQQRFNARVEELAAITRLNRVRAEKAVEDVSAVWIGMKYEDKKKIIGYGRSMEAASRTKADTEWAAALLDAKIPKEQILKIWDVKDEISRGEDGED